MKKISEEHNVTVVMSADELNAILELLDGVQKLSWDEIRAIVRNGQTANIIWNMKISHMMDE